MPQIDIEFDSFRNETFSTQFLKLAQNPESINLLVTLRNHPENGTDMYCDKLSVGSFQVNLNIAHHFDENLNFYSVLRVYLEKFKDNNSFRVCFVDIREKFMALIISDVF